MQTFEVIFETTIFKTVTVTAVDKDEAADKAMDMKYPGELNLPYGFELDHEHWSVSDVVDPGDE